MTCGPSWWDCGWRGGGGGGWGWSGPYGSTAGGFTWRRRLPPSKPTGAAASWKTDGWGPAVRVRLFLVRHGETESNRLGLALGRSDVPLNERGRWQAERLAGALRGEPLAAVYSRPLRRTLGPA